MSEKSSAMGTLGLRLPESVHASLKAEADRRQTTISNLIRAGVAQTIQGGDPHRSSSNGEARHG